MMEVLVEVEAAIKRAESRLNNINPLTENEGEISALGKWSKATRQTKAELEFLWQIKKYSPTLYAWLKGYIEVTPTPAGIEHAFDDFLVRGADCTKFFLDHNRGHGWEIRYHVGEAGSEVLRLDPVDLLTALSRDVEGARRGLNSAFQRDIEECMEGRKGSAEWGLSRYIQQDLEKIAEAKQEGDAKKLAFWEASLPKTQAAYRFWKTLQEHPRLEEEIDKLATEDFWHLDYDEQWNHLIAALFAGGPYTMRRYDLCEWGQPVHLMHGTSMRMALSREIHKRSGGNSSDAFKYVGY